VHVVALAFICVCSLPCSFAFGSSMLPHAGVGRTMRSGLAARSAFVDRQEIGAARKVRGGFTGFALLKAQLSEEDEEDLQRMKDERVLPFDKGSSEFVPSEMQPANEWINLKEEFMFDWTLLPTKEFALKLGGVFGFFFFFVSLPIAGTTYDAPDEAALRFLASTIGATAATLALNLRFLVFVSFVSSRLSEGAVYFESDERRPITTTDLQRLGYRSQGAMWIKPPEILARDRLMKQMEVNPVMEKLKRTTGGLSAALLASIVLFNIANYGVADGFDPRFFVSEQRLRDLNNPNNEAVANQEGERLRKRGNKPAYCYSRYYKSIASSDDSVCAD